MRKIFTGIVSSLSVLAIAGAIAAYANDKVQDEKIKTLKELLLEVRSDVKLILHRQSK